MELIIFALAFYGAYILWNGISKGGILNIHIPFVTNRALFAVKAAWYLILLEDGASSNDANNTVSRMDVNMPTEMIIVGQGFIRERYNGKQSSVIHDARQLGLWG